MASDRSKARFCTRCGKPREETGPLSYRGICESCREQGSRKNIEQIAGHEGEYFRNWRKQMAASVGGILLDDLPPEIRALL